MADNKLHFDPSKIRYTDESMPHDASAANFPKAQQPTESVPVTDRLEHPSEQQFDANDTNAGQAADNLSKASAAPNTDSINISELSDIIKNCDAVDTQTSELMLRLLRGEEIGTAATGSDAKAATDTDSTYSENENVIENGVDLSITDQISAAVAAKQDAVNAVTSEQNSGSANDGFGTAESVISEDDNSSVTDTSNAANSAENLSATTVFPSPVKTTNKSLNNATYISDGDKTENTNETTDKHDEKKKSGIVRFFSFFVPWKGDPAREIIRKCVFLVALVVFIAAFGNLAVYLKGRVENDSFRSHTKDMIDENNTTVGEDGILNKYRALYNDNNDFRGWITIPNTNVDGAVYQSTDNSYYLTHNGQKKSTVYGAYFMDYKCTVGGQDTSQNITLYGHHMKDQTMFAQIRKYKTVEFYKENPTLTFDTIYKTGTYKVFAAFITNADPNDDNGYFFDFTVQGFINQEDFLAWIEQVRRRSLINTTVDVNKGDEILTLSTCTYELGTSKDMRFIVMARKVRDGETSTVNVAQATQNSSPLYPAAWYARYGSKKPTFSDGLYTWGDTSSHQSSATEHVVIPSTSTDETSSGRTPSSYTPSFVNPFDTSSRTSSAASSKDPYAPVPNPTESDMPWYTPSSDPYAFSSTNPWDSSTNSNLNF